MLHLSLNRDELNISMKRDKKLDRALNGPSIFEVTFGAVLSILLGLTICVLFLIFKPVETVKILPKESEKIVGQIYYVEGVRDTSKAKQWRRKKQILIEGITGEIALSEEDLNEAFMPEITSVKVQSVKPPAAAKPGEPAVAVVDGDLLVFSPPNFRVRDSAVQVGATVTVNVPSYSVPVVIQALGDFRKNGEYFMYNPRTFFCGSLPVHRIPGASQWLINKVMVAHGFPVTGGAAWRKISNVIVDGRMLKLTLP